LNPLKRLSAMREDQHGYNDPRKTLVALATDSTCSICGEEPCIIITMASMLVLQAGTVESHVSGINYDESLKSLNRCVKWHKYGAASRIWKAMRASTSRVNNTHEEKTVASNGQVKYSEARDPPNLN